MGQERALLLLTGGRDGQRPFHEAVAGGALRAKAAFAPEHRRADRLLRSVVRRLDAWHGHERPQRGPELEQRRAEVRGLVAVALLALLQHPAQAPVVLA